MEEDDGDDGGSGKGKENEGPVLVVPRLLATDTEQNEEAAVIVPSEVKQVLSSILDEIESQTMKEGVVEDENCNEVASEGSSLPPPPQHQDGDKVRETATKSGASEEQASSLSLSTTDKPKSTSNDNRGGKGRRKMRVLNRRRMLSFRKMRQLFHHPSQWRQVLKKMARKPMKPPVVVGRYSKPSQDKAEATSARIKVTAEKKKEPIIDQLPTTPTRKQVTFQDGSPSDETVTKTDDLIKQHDAHKEDSGPIPPTPANEPNQEENESSPPSPVDLGKNGQSPDLPDSDSTTTTPSQELFKCRKCGMELRHQSSLQRHMKLHSSVGRPWKCSECECFFPDKPSLRSHESRRHGKKDCSSKCDICDIPLPGESRFKEHMKVHQDSSSKPFKCALCPSFYAAAANLSAHELRVHQKKVEVVMCHSCGEMFSSRSKMLQHMKIKHDEGKTEENVVVIDLDSSESEEDQATPHWRTLLSQLKPCALILTRCDHQLPKYVESTTTSGSGRRKSGRVKSSISRLTSASTGTERTYPCPYCYKPFLGARLLIEHLPAHKTGEAPRPRISATSKHSPTKEPISPSSKRSKTFKCSHCNYSCNAEQTLQTHMLKLHSDLARPFKCTMCKSSFATPKTLKNHEDRVHQNSKQLQRTLPVPTHKCQQCDYSTKLLSQLKNHMKKVHLKEGRPYKCTKSPQCHFTSLSFQSLRTHEAQFHKAPKPRNNKPIIITLTDTDSINAHKCSRCNYSTDILQEWENHMEGHRRNDACRSSYNCSQCEACFQQLAQLQIHTEEMHTIEIL